MIFKNDLLEGCLRLKMIKKRFESAFGFLIFSVEVTHSPRLEALSETFLRKSHIRVTKTPYFILSHDNEKKR